MITALSAGQKAAGHDVTVASVLTSEPVDHPFMETLRRQGIPTEVLVEHARAYASERRSIRRLCRELRPSVVHTHGYRSDIVDGGAARGERIATVSTVHGFTGGALLNRFYEHLQCRFLRKFDAVVAVSTPIYKRLTDAGVPPARTHLLPNAFTIDRPNLSRVDTRRILGIADGELRIGFVGRLSPEKGPDVLIEATKHIDPLITVSFVGDGRMRQVLVDRARALNLEKRVVWHGIIPDAGRLLAAFDLLVLSSRTEGTPIILLEALSAGIPVVTTTVGGVPDMVSDKEAVLVPSEDPTALARGIERCLADPVATAERVREGLNVVRKRFDTSAWVAEYDRIYRTITAVQNWK